MDFENEKLADLITLNGCETLSLSNTDEKLIRNFLKDCYYLEIRVTELELENKALNERLSQCEKEIKSLRSKKEY